MTMLRHFRRLTVAVVGVVGAVVISAPAAGAVEEPGVPDALRISNGPYAGFQQCALEHPVVDTSSALLAASPTPPASGGPIFGPYPGLVGTFEVALPDEDAFLRQSREIESNGHTFAFQVPDNTLPNGEYRWRIRAEDGSQVSDWSPWCPFTVRVP